MFLSIIYLCFFAHFLDYHGNNGAYLATALKLESSSDTQLRRSNDHWLMVMFEAMLLNNIFVFFFLFVCHEMLNSIRRYWLVGCSSPSQHLVDQSITAKINSSTIELIICQNYYAINSIRNVEYFIINCSFMITKYISRIKTKISLIFCDSVKFRLSNYWLKKKYCCRLSENEAVFIFNQYFRLIRVNICKCQMLSKLLLWFWLSFICRKCDQTLNFTHFNYILI